MYTEPSSVVTPSKYGLSAWKSMNVTPTGNLNTFSGWKAFLRLYKHTSPPPSKSGSSEV